MIAVLDSNAVIGLAKGECLELIRALFQQVLIPTVVRPEVIEGGAGRPGSRELLEALGAWAKEQAPVGKTLDAGMPTVSADDQQVLALAEETSAILVTDDAVLRREAERLGILALGTVETLLLLKRRQALPAVKPVLDLMQARAYHIEPSLYTQALQLAGEKA